ncbi:DUF2953 domain-containing protein [Lacrimispora sp.]|uniref:DUF2953 domain-containing protein n=1 Tax=Lacrimispora sp. TaxID=2719234 RepID=UPI002FDA0B8A
MVHIILLILKILGLLLLVVLGLILLLLLLVLLVPVRYRAEGSYYEKVKGKVRVSWLLHLISVTLSYEEDFIMTVRLFGFRILKPKKMDHELREAGEIMVQTMEIKPEEAVEDIKEEIQKKPEKGRMSWALSRKEKKSQSQFLSRKEKKSQSRVWTYEEDGIQSQTQSHKEEDIQSQDRSGKEEDIHNRSQPSKEGKPPEDDKKISWFSKLKEKIRKQLLKLKFFFHRICDTLKAVKDKKETLQAWVSNKENQKTVKLLLRQLKKLIRHILPRRGKGNVTFGFDDPYVTGQVLTYASVVYPFCHKHLNLYPVFDQVVFKADGNFRGRVRIGTILAIGGRMLLDKNFRVQLKKWLR